MLSKNIKLYKNRIKRLAKENGLDREYFRKTYDVSDAAISVWFSGKRYPPFNIIMEIVRKSGTNLSYVLGMTDISTPVKNFDPHMDLKKVIKESGETITSVARKMDTSTHVVTSCFGKDTPGRTNTMIALADALEVSVDYLLGLTDYRTWEDEMISREPFTYIKPGTPAIIYNPDTNEKCYCLLSNDGRVCYLPDGTSNEKNEFKGCIVKQVSFTEQD